MTDKESLFAKEESFEVTINGVTFTCRKLSGMEYTRCIDSKQPSLMFRNLILKSCVEPKFTAAEVDRLDISYLSGLAAAIVARYGDAAEDFQNP